LDRKGRLERELGSDSLVYGPNEESRGAASMVSRLRSPDSSRGAVVLLVHGFYAGLFAGTVATVSQLALWLTFTETSPWILLLRDARFTAAIVAGPALLSAPLTFDAVVIALATLIHFALSTLYGVVFFWLAQDVRSAAIRLPLGALFGFGIYLKNLYVFTLLFPWFSEARDGVTLAAHLVFGLSLAGAHWWLTELRREK